MEGALASLDRVSTFADGIAVKHPGENTYNIIKEYVDDIVTVTNSRGEKRPVAEFRKTVVSRSCSDEIDLRGMTGDEAWLAVDKYLDEVMLAGLHTVRLIHGKGTGALKAALWRMLKGDGRISSYRIGQYGEGDGGVTVVELK